MERIFGKKIGQDPNQNQMLLHLKSALIENKSIIDRVLIRFIFNGEPDDAEKSAVLDSLREKLEAKKFLLDIFFGKQIELTFQFLSNINKALGGLNSTDSTHQFTLKIEGSLSVCTPSGKRMNVGFIKLMDLYGMYKEMGLKFFERNIRAGISSDKAPNRAIRNALKNIVLDLKEPSEVFAFNHNGVTLNAQQFEEENGFCKVIEPRLLNGAQTITNVAEFLKLNERNPAIDKNKESLDSIKILSKIIWDAPTDFVTNVTICNNKQNPVLPWN